MKRQPTSADKQYQGLFSCCVHFHRPPLIPNDFELDLGWSTQHNYNRGAEMPRTIGALGKPRTADLVALGFVFDLIQAAAEAEARGLNEGDRPDLRFAEALDMIVDLARMPGVSLGVR